MVANVYVPSFDRQASLRTPKMVDKDIQCELITTVDGSSPVMNKTISNISYIQPALRSDTSHNQFSSQQLNNTRVDHAPPPNQDDYFSRIAQ